MTPFLLPPLQIPPTQHNPASKHRWDLSSGFVKIPGEETKEKKSSCCPQQGFSFTFSLLHLVKYMLVFFQDSQYSLCVLSDVVKSCYQFSAWTKEVQGTAIKDLRILYCPLQALTMFSFEETTRVETVEQ